MHVSVCLHPTPPHSTTAALHFTQTHTHCIMSENCLNKTDATMEWGRGERIVRLTGKTKRSGYTRLELRTGCEGGTQPYQKALARSHEPLLWLEHSTRRRTGCFVVRLPKISFILCSCTVSASCVTLDFMRFCKWPEMFYHSRRAIRVDYVNGTSGQTDLHWLPLTRLENIPRPEGWGWPKRLPFSACW